jgi:hypothetical protein
MGARSGPWWSSPEVASTRRTTAGGLVGRFRAVPLFFKRSNYQVCRSGGWGHVGNAAALPKLVRRTSGMSAALPAVPCVMPARLAAIEVRLPGPSRGAGGELASLVAL